MGSISKEEMPTRLASSALPSYTHHNVRSLSVFILRLTKDLFKLRTLMSTTSSLRLQPRPPQHININVELLEALDAQLPSIPRATEFP
ncbi:hypothetical protein GE21DRAFT_1104385 [Neurospora crassa]|nr:hypothetical protein GE21DRAFT_1104385 [Neurospora crassa]